MKLCLKSAKLGFVGINDNDFCSEPMSRPLDGDDCGFLM